MTEREPDEPSKDFSDAGSHPGRSIGDFIARTDRDARLVKAARAARRLTPDPAVPELDLSARSRLSDRIHRLVGSGSTPSASRELTLAAISVWQALVDRRGGGSGRGETADVTILFTDLVGFSTWALDAGDDSVLALIGEVNRVSAEVIGDHRGRIVKSLGDGVMAVFADATEAIHAAFELSGAVSAITHDGYRPALRAGLHSGSPKRVGNDYLGVDVNIAARVADAAANGEVLATDATLEAADPEQYVLRKRRFRAKGTPRDIGVFSVVPRYPEA